MDNKYIPGHGSINSKLMIIGECPSLKDHQAGKIIEERELSQVLKDAGINRSEIWHTNVCKFHVPPNSGKKKIPFHVRAKALDIEYETCLSDLRNEINALKPNCILALGKTALHALYGQTNITSYRGSILLGMGIKFVPTYQPAQLNWQSEDIEFKGYYNRQIMIFDFKRANEQSVYPEIRRPNRTLEICRNSAHLIQFYDRYKHLSDVSVDVEAHGSGFPVCIGLSFNKSHGMCVPLWNTDGISTIPDSDMVQIWLILAMILEKHDIIGQNFNYDKDKLVRLGFRIRKLIDDTMMSAMGINPELPKGLGFNTSIYTEEPFYKDEGMYHGKIEDLFIGCARDACVTYEIRDKHRIDLEELGQIPFYRNFLMELPELYLHIQSQGFKVDPEERDRLLRKYIAWDEKVRYELFKIHGSEINVNSPKQISILLFDNLKLPIRHGTGEEEITSLLNLQSVKDPNIRKTLELILEGRRVRKSISTYMMALPDYDGRMKTSYFPCLETGRTSTGQLDPPLRPTIQVIDENGKKKDKVIGIAFQTMTKHGDIGSDIRGMYVPD